MQPQSIKKFLADSSVLLTGVTGFVGGSLLERILRISPGPEKVFVLVRKRQGMDPQIRLKKILSSPLFSDVHPDKFDRIHLIQGDITADRLGLSTADNNLLISKCTHVFHSAAFISFAAQLEMAIKINLVGSRRILALAKEMENIQAMVYVSTAYANCEVKSPVIEEKLYPPKWEPREFIEMMKNLPPQEIEKRTPEFIGNHPNTYTFSKQLAENLLVKERDNLPLSIVRPSIVLNTWKMPVPGWVDNVNNGACAFIAGTAKGLFRTIQGKPDNLQNIIPADLVVSTILASAVRAIHNPTKVHIFHCSSSVTNPTTWGNYCKQIVKASREHPCENAVWYPEARVRSAYSRNVVVIYIFQIMPAYIIDIILRRMGQKMSLLDLQLKYLKGTKYIQYFTVNQWNFDRKNTTALINDMSPDEKKAHPIDPNLIEWNSYYENCVLGMRRYFHKESATTTETAHRQMKRLEKIAKITPYVSFSIFWSLMFLLGCPPLIGALLSGSLLSFLIWL